jgi:hypothetical protein
MGLFQSNKQQAKKKTSPDDAAAASVEIFDDHYRDELRTIGRNHFQKIMDDNAILFKRDLDATISQVSTELKDYLTTKLDATIASVNGELTKRLSERLAESDRAAKDAQDLAVQSLNRNAQILHDKYQQLSQTLQQSIASQEAMMITVFEENKARMITTQGAQEMVLQSLKGSAGAAQQQSQQLSEALQKTAADQQAQMTKAFEDNTARVAATKQAQDAALQALNSSAQALDEQYQQLSQTVQKAVASQETKLIDVFQENMAQIIEHYLLGALGDQYDIKAQLPSIIKQMDANKQAMADDMKL